MVTVIVTRLQYDQEGEWLRQRELSKRKISKRRGTRELVGPCLRMAKPLRIARMAEPHHEGL